MNADAWSFADWIVIAVPIGFALVALRLGVPQMREFHRHTGDSSLLVSIFAFSRFRDEEEQPRLPLSPAPKAKKPDCPKVG